MQEPHREDSASHPDPESCVRTGNGAGEALTGAHAGQPLSCEIRSPGAPTPLSEAEGHTEPGAHGEPDSGPAQSQTLHMRGNSLRGKREIPWTPGGDEPPGRPEKVNDRTSGVYVCGKSDGRVVPEKLLNKGGTLPPAEGVEERRPTEGNTPKAAASRTQSRTSASMARQRVHEVARRDRRARFTALLHHIRPELLRESFYALKRMAAPGIDGVTWKQYEVDLQALMPNTRSKSRMR